MINAFVKDAASFVAMMRIDDTDLISRIVWDPETPDYIFVSEQFYLVKQIYEEYIRYLQKFPDSIWIGIYRECLMPDLNLFDYVICFDSNGLGDRVSRIPMIMCFGDSIFTLNNEMTMDEARSLYREKRFCNFMYGNGNAHLMRDRIFYKISEYK